MIPTYTGAAVYTEQDKFQKIEFSSLDKIQEKNQESYTKSADNGWVAMLQHYFLSAWLPKDNSPREYYAKEVGVNMYSAGVIVPVGLVDAGKSIKMNMPLYAGGMVASSVRKAELVKIVPNPKFPRECVDKAGGWA